MTCGLYIAMKPIKKMLVNIGKNANNSLHADCRKRRAFCKKPQNARHSRQPVKLALAYVILKTRSLFKGLIPSHYIGIFINIMYINIFSMFQRGY